MRKRLEIALVALGCLNALAAFAGFPRLAAVLEATMASPAPVPFAGRGMHTEKFSRSSVAEFEFADGTSLRADYHALRKTIPGPMRYRMTYAAADFLYAAGRLRILSERLLRFSACEANGPIYRALGTDKEVRAIRFQYDWPWTEEKVLEKRVECLDERI